MRQYQETRYPFDAIWINGRHVGIGKILQEKEPVFSAFEESTFQFIRLWLQGEQTFRIATSGSTGKPKVISVLRSQMVESSLRTAQKINLQKNTTALVCIDTRYIGGMMMLARSLTIGLPIMAVAPVANPLIKIPVDKCVQFTALVPYQVQAILESKHPHLLNGLDTLLIGGAHLSEALRSKLDRFQVDCFETYGMTETVSHVALRRVNGNSKLQHFETLPGIEISQDDRGCLKVSADFLGGPIVTNDLVEITGPQTFRWAGRWDRVINSGGVKVMPEKIEGALERIFAEHQFHHRFFIAALPDERLGSKVVLVLEGVHFSSEPLERSLEALKAAVKPYEFPKELYSNPSFVDTGSQKVDRIQSLPDAMFYTSLK
jgi:O-succinylbenzoic acid--CoA ligase